MGKLETCSILIRGTMGSNVEFENCWRGDGLNIVSKIYKIQLNWYTKDKTAKEEMVRWAINI